jgi:hypothetical protein
LHQEWDSDAGVFDSFHLCPILASGRTEMSEEKCLPGDEALPVTVHRKGPISGAELRGQQNDEYNCRPSPTGMVQECSFCV